MALASLNEKDGRKVNVLVKVGIIILLLLASRWSWIRFPPSPSLFRLAFHCFAFTLVDLTLVLPVYSSEILFGFRFNFASVCAISVNLHHLYSPMALSSSCSTLTVNIEEVGRRRRRRGRPSTSAFLLLYTAPFILLHLSAVSEATLSLTSDFDRQFLASPGTSRFFTCTPIDTHGDDNLFLKEMRWTWNSMPLLIYDYIKGSNWYPSTFPPGVNVNVS